MKTCTVRHAGREFMFTCRDDFMGRRLDYGRFYEGRMLDHIAGLNLKGVYVDVGAFIGTHSVYFSELCPGCSEVIAFEPNPSSYDLLIENMARNSGPNRRWRLRMEAVGNINGEGWLEAGPSDNHGMARVWPEGDIPVHIVTIDHALDGENVALIKIDTEGGELDALAGATETLRRCRPHIFVETEDEPSVTALLLPLGYERRERFNATPTWHYQPRG